MLIVLMAESINQTKMESCIFFSIVFNVSPLGDIYFRKKKNRRERNAKKSCKLENDVYHVAALPLANIA